MNWTLEVVVVPVSDIDRAKAFYAMQPSFLVDHDTTGNVSLAKIERKHIE